MTLPNKDDKAGQVSFQPVGSGDGQTPGQPSGQVQQDPGEGADPKFITLEDAQRLADQAEERAYRRAQGLVDKADNRIGKQVREAVDKVKSDIALMRNDGVEISEQLEQEMVNNATREAYQSPPPESDTVSSDPGDRPTDPVTAEAWRMMEAAGISIDDGDPELEMLNQESEYAFLHSVEQAIAAKKKRLDGAGTQTPETTRLPTTVGGTGRHVQPNYLEMDDQEHWEQAKKKW